jgi:hypothetical protein
VKLVAFAQKSLSSLFVFTRTRPGISGRTHQSESCGRPCRQVGRRASRPVGHESAIQVQSTESGTIRHADAPFSVVHLLTRLVAPICSS